VGTGFPKGSAAIQRERRAAIQRKAERLQSTIAFPRIAVRLQSFDETDDRRFELMGSEAIVV